MKHTPGPWWLEENTDTIRSGPRTADGLNPESVEIDLYFNQTGNVEARANATLVAAAPDLLAALKLLVSHVYSGGAVRMDDAHMERALDVVRKAEGGK